MSGSGGGTHEDGQGRPTLAPRRVTADPRKFSAYVLEPENADDKDSVFVDLLGYRPRNGEDAEERAATYVAQARDQIARGNYVEGERDSFGRRYTIEIVLRGIVLRSGWILRDDETLALATSFAGFARRARRP